MDLLSGSAVHPHPVRATRGLLQGCPASPCLLNATMTLWVLTVQRSAPDVRFAVYLDDRSIWQLGTSDLGPLLAATRAGQEVDVATGMTLHPGKLGCFALASSLRRALALNADVFGPVTTMPRLLGITYMIGGRTLCAPASQASHAVAHRCRKIARAGRTLRLRRFLLTLLVVSLFRWTGPWHRYAVADLYKWTGHAETTLWGGHVPRERSALLLWGALGTPRAHPLFALHFEALRHQWRACARPTQQAPCPRFVAALTYFKAGLFSVSVIGLRPLACSLLPGTPSPPFT